MATKRRFHRGFLCNLHPRLTWFATLLLLIAGMVSINLKAVTLPESIPDFSLDTSRPGVQSVQSGSRALEVLSSKIVSAVMLDLLMPGMDGFQVIGHIRQQATLKQLPIFVMTGKTLTEQELAILGKDTQAFFQKGKPWQQHLVTEINRVIQGERAKAAGQH